MQGKRISRVMGGIWIITSLAWAILGVLGLLYGLKWIENLQVNLDENLELVIVSLDSIETIVGDSTKIISDTYQSLETVGNSTSNAATAITDMRPLIWKTTKVVTEDVPNALDGVQDSMPTLIETANSVDETLRWISNFQIAIPIPFAPDYIFDFGVEYSPEVPLDQALETMSGNLAEIPDDLRGMEEDLENLDENLLLIRDDLSQLSENIVTLNSKIVEINPSLDQLAGNISGFEKSFSEIKTKIPASFEQARKILIVLMGLLILTQLPSMYFGWLLLRGTMFPKEVRPE